MIAPVKLVQHESFHRWRESADGLNAPAWIVEQLAAQRYPDDCIVTQELFEALHAILRNAPRCK